MGYASFWKRWAAYVVDGAIYGLISGMISGIINTVFELIAGDNPSVGVSLTFSLVSISVSLAVWAAYYAWPESSEWQATIGKHLFGLRVTDTNGQRISFWRAVWRNFAKIFSAIILFIGYMMCGWTERKQCLHDMMADCLVLDEHPGEKQGCMWAVVGVSIGMLFISIIVFVLAASFIASLISH